MQKSSFKNYNSSKKREKHFRKAPKLLKRAAPKIIVPRNQYVCWEGSQSRKSAASQIIGPDKGTIFV